MNRPDTYKLIGYARVSTEEQSLDQQVDALLKAGVLEEDIFQESISSTKEVRPEFDRMDRRLREGDILIVTRLDRLGRSMTQLSKYMEDLDERGVQFRSLSEGFDTSTAVGKFIFHMFAAFAEMERNLISERTKEALEAKRRRGQAIGRPAQFTQTAWHTACELRKDGMPFTQIKKELEKAPVKCKIHVNTLYKYKELINAGADYPAQLIAASKK